MRLDDLRDNWDDLGRVDPLWAVLAYPEYRGNRWSVDEFFATGRAQVKDLLREVTRAGGTVPPSGRALDVGCGAGRLTQALADYVHEVHGVDIAASMVELARSHNRHPDRVSYHLVEGADLRSFPIGHFDLVVSVVVLQHVPNDVKTAYLREFLRVLTPGGIAAFTLPSHADLSPVGLLRRLPNRAQNVYRRRRHGYRAVMEFHTMRRGRVLALLRQAGAEVLAVTEEPMAGPPFTSYLYVVRRPVSSR